MFSVGCGDREGKGNAISDMTQSEWKYRCVIQKLDEMLLGLKRRLQGWRNERRWDK